MGRLRDKMRRAFMGTATRQAMAALKREAIEVNGAIWDTNPEGRIAPYPFVWVEESGRPRVRALEQAHNRATEQGQDDIDFVYQWVSTRPTRQENAEGVARLNVTIPAIDGKRETIAFWFPLPAFVAQLRFMADTGGVSVTSMTPEQIIDEPLWRGFSVAFTPSVTELRTICDAWDTTTPS